MSTEKKKAEALSGAEMSAIAGGSNGNMGNSKDGTPGGGEFIVRTMNEKLSEAEMSKVAGGASRGGSSGGAEFLVDPDRRKF